MKSKLWIDIICFLLILLFMYASASKLLEYEKFLVELGQSPLLTAFAGWVAWIIPAIEIFIAVMLAIPYTRTIGLYASFSLMVIFSAYIIAILQFSDFVPCSCGGILQNMSWKQHLLFNLGFIALSLTGIVFQSKQNIGKQKNSPTQPVDMGITIR